MPEGSSTFKRWFTTPPVKRSFWLLSFIAFAVLSFQSCGGVKYEELLMFEDVRNEQGSIDSIPVLRIQTDDILGIQVASKEPDLMAVFQQPDRNSASAGEGAFNIQEGGYRVDEEGNVYLPYIGQIKAAGISIMQLRQKLNSELQRFYPDATVQVRFLNFRVTLMGEVNRPNAYTIPNERLNVLEAIGMAGDFTSYANRSFVLVVRERDDSREFQRLNLQDKALFESPYFYLQPNDLVYVEPLRARQYATQGDFLQRYSGVLLPIVSLLTFGIGLAIR